MSLSLALCHSHSHSHSVTGLVGAPACGDVMKLQIRVSVCVCVCLCVCVLCVCVCWGTCMRRRDEAADQSVCVCVCVCVCARVHACLQPAHICQSNMETRILRTRSHRHRVIKHKFLITLAT